MTRYCFLDVRRVCEHDCMAWSGTEDDEPDCLLLDTLDRLQKLLLEETSAITHPVSAPPPEVT